MIIRNKTLWISRSNFIKDNLYNFMENQDEEIKKPEEEMTDETPAQEEVATPEEE